MVVGRLVIFLSRDATELPQGTVTAVGRWLLAAGHAVGAGVWVQGCLWGRGRATKRSGVDPPRVLQLRLPSRGLHCIHSSQFIVCQTVRNSPELCVPWVPEPPCLGSERCLVVGVAGVLPSTPPPPLQAIPCWGGGGSATQQWSTTVGTKFWISQKK